jgi:acetyltransferase-like isoleucine patch superfamily enzyme
MDIRGILFNRILYVKSKISIFRGNFYVRIYSFFNGIKLGNNIVFCGKPIIRRYPYSSISIGNNCKFRSDFTIALGYNKKCIILTRLRNSQIIIGNDCGFNAVVISACESISIGNNVLIGYNTKIIDYDGHSSEDIEKPGQIKPVVICDRVFIGMNVTILKGVTIGENSVIGANSIVVKDIPANVIAAGNPCKVIRQK